MSGYGPEYTPRNSGGRYNRCIKGAGHVGKVLLDHVAGQGISQSKYAGNGLNALRSNGTILPIYVYIWKGSIAGNLPFPETC